MKTITHLMIVILSIVAFGLGAASAAEVEIPNNFQAGTPAVAAEVNENFAAIENAILSIDSYYNEFGSLNQSHVTVSSVWTKLNTGEHIFTKEDEGTKIEVYVNARFRAGNFSDDASLIRFQVRIDDDILYDFGNDGSIITDNSYEFLSILNVFQNLTAGQHIVSLWARTDGGISENVIVDPYGVGGKIIVKETW